MPRSGQIIPAYLHPHEETYINDNTRYEDYVSGESGVRFLNVFASSKGRDNVLLNFTSVSDWVNEYGLPDYRRYGQPGYNAYVALSTGLASSQSMRVMPPDAAYANMVLLAKYQVLDGKLKMKFETKTVTGILNSDDLQAYVDRMEDSEPDEEGYQTLPIMSFWSRGRGVYGNDYRVRISRDKGADKENDYVNYVFELLTMENGSLETLESYNVSMYIDAIDPNSNFTLFVNDIIDDEDNKGSTRFNCSVIYDNLVKLFEAYQEAFEEATTVTVEEVAALPPTTLPDENLVYVCAGEAKVFDPELGTFKSFESGAMVVEATVAPVVLGVEEPGAQPYYIVETNNTNKVWKYEDDAMTAQAGAYHSVADISLEDSLVENDFYYDEATSTYYIAGATNTKTTIQAVATTATCAEGAMVADTGIMYDVAGVFYTFSGTELNTVSNVSEVAELPSTEIAKENDLDVSEKKDSQEICFIPNNNYKDFLNKKMPNKEGNIILENGQVLGRHNGLVNYTIGQRKGLGIAYKEPLYVIKLDITKNEVIVGNEKSLYSKELYAKNCNWFIFDKLENEITCYAKVRYRAKKAKVKVYNKDGKVKVEFFTFQRAITPGQSVVFYDEDGIMLGGGIINNF